MISISDIDPVSVHAIPRRWDINPVEPARCVQEPSTKEMCPVVPQWPTGQRVMHCDDSLASLP